MNKNKNYFFNEIYEKKNRYIKPKEIFTYLIKILKKEKLKKNLFLVEIGCSNGELLYNLHKNFKNIIFTGIDVDRKHLKKAQENCSREIRFKKGDISKKINGIGKFDL